MTRRPAQQHGFTLIEMIVAITIILLMMFVIDKLFNDASLAVRMGVALSDLTHRAQAVSHQLDRDASRMLGPTRDGFLVIVNNAISAPIALPQGGESSPASFRDDTLLFVADSSGWTPLTPQGNAGYANASTAAAALVCYGHGLSLRSDGSAPTEDNLSASATLLQNRLAHRWLLARQATFLAGASAQGPALVGDPTAANLQAGTRDVSTWLLYSLTGPAGTGKLTDAVNYTTTALTYALYGTSRLRINPRPVSSVLTDTDEVAKTHGLLAENCSDFIVEFAADANNDGNIDTYTTNDANGCAQGEIIWYSAANPPDGSITPANGRGDWTRNADWGSTYNPKSGNAFVWRHTDTQAYTSGASKHSNSKWPYLIRIRYRLHDAQGKLGSGAAGQLEPGKWFEQIIKVPRP